MVSLQVRCPLAHPANSVEALDGTQSTDRSQGKLHIGLMPAFLIHQVIPEGRNDVLHLCVFMVALWNRADHYIFALWFLSSFYLFFPRLISAAADWMSTILRHMMWP